MNDYRYRSSSTLEKNILLRFLQSTMVIVCLYAVYNFSDHNYSDVLKCGVALLVFGACYAFVYYTGGSSLSIRVTVTLFMLSTVSGFFFQGGFFGITSLDLCALIVALTMILTGFERRVFLLLCVLQILGLAGIQLFHSEWIVDYRATDPVFVDIAEILARIGNMLYIGSLYKTEYEKERKELFETSEQLKASNAEVSRQYDVIASTNDQLKMAMLLLKEEQAQTLEANRKLKEANATILVHDKYITAYNNQLKILVTELRNEREQVLETNEKLEEANAEISAQSDTIANYNRQLEAMVEERMKDILQLNKKLIEYSFTNSHKIRGPLARVLGLIHLMKMNPGSNGINCEEYFDKLEASAHELDEVVRRITILLNNEP